RLTHAPARIHIVTQIAAGRALVLLGQIPVLPGDHRLVHLAARVGHLRPLGALGRTPIVGYQGPLIARLHLFALGSEATFALRYRLLYRLSLYRLLFASEHISRLMDTGGAAAPRSLPA